MSLANLSTCPPDITEITTSVCGRTMGQITGGGLQQLPRTISYFATGVNDIGDATSWVAARADSAPNTIVLTPAISNFEIPASEGIFEGGDDNSTVGGLRLTVRDTNPVATGEFKASSWDYGYDLNEQISRLSQPTGNSNKSLGVYLWDFDNQGWWGKNDGSGGLLPIPVYSVRVSSPTALDRNIATMQMIEAQFLPTWGDNLVFAPATFTYGEILPQ